MTEVEVETDDAAESPAEILRQVTAEQKDVQEYLSFLTQLRAGKGSSPASASAEQPSQADIAEEESSVREYATFLAEVKAKLEAGQAIKEIEGIDSDEVDVAPVEKFVSDLADEEASREAAAGESDSTSASSDSDSEEFDTQQDGGDDDDGGPEAPPTKEEIDKEEALGQDRSRRRDVVCVQTEASNWSVLTVFCSAPPHCPFSILRFNQ